MGWFQYKCTSNFIDMYTLNNGDLHTAYVGKIVRKKGSINSKSEKKDHSQ